MALPVKVAIVPHRKFKFVRAIFTAQEGIDVADGRRYEMLRDVEAEQILQHQVMIQPSRDGLYLISVGLETDGDEGNITRSYSIPIIVQANAAPAAPTCGFRRTRARGRESTAGMLHVGTRPGRSRDRRRSAGLGTAPNRGRSGA